MESVAKVRGPKGSNVILGIRRDGTEMNITVMRDLIQVPEIIITKQQNVTIVKIVQFGNKTDRELRSIMAEIEEERPRGIIIDLRNNPGGLLHAADVVVSNFLPHGSTVARIKSRTDDYTEKTMDPPTISSDVPVVVLVNKGSASASEIVAGALQDAKRATIVGEKTFGKGTVQQIMEFLNGSGLKMTIAEWFTPAGRKIDGVGITPDVEVAASEDNRDVQLLKALDLIR
jgi:carboxyl-terminal processing protease